MGAPGLCARLACFSVIAVCSDALASPDLETLSLGADVRVVIPRGLSHERQPLGRGELLTISRGDEVLVISVYRTGADGKAPPTPEAARKAHTQALVKQLTAVATPVSVRPARLLGQARATTALSLPGHPERSGFVAAAADSGITLVVGTLVKTDSETAREFESLLGTISVKKVSP